MRLIILNRKRLGVTAIILGLMLVMFAVEERFDERLRATALMHSDISSLIKYEGLDRKFSYSLPNQWDVSLKNFGNQEIVYHNDFNTKDQSIHGFVQVWNLREDLKTFLERSKETAGAVKPLKYKAYKMEPISINAYSGYLISYAMDMGEGKYYKGYEYYLSQDGLMFRFSFFVSEGNFKENMPTVFNTIVRTFQYNMQ
jgi:hypothetical protein